MRDAQLRYMRWNPMMEKLTGVPAERAIVRTTEQVFPEMDAPLRDALQDALDRALQGKLVVTPDRLIDRPDKRYRTTAIHGPLRDAQGRVVGAISSVQEITDRKRSEEQPLQESATPGGHVAVDRRCRHFDRRRGPYQPDERLRRVPDRLNFGAGSAQELR